MRWMGSRAWGPALALIGACQLPACTCTRPPAEKQDSTPPPAATAWADSDQRLARALWAAEVLTLVRVRDLRVSPAGEFCMGCGSENPFLPESPLSDASRARIRELGECAVKHLSAPPEGAVLAKVVLALEAKQAAKAVVEGDAQVVSALQPCKEAFEKAMAGAETEPGRVELKLTFILDNWCDRPPVGPAAPANATTLLTDSKQERQFVLMPGWFLHCKEATAWRTNADKDGISVTDRDGKRAASARWTAGGFEVLDDQGARAIAATGGQGRYGLERGDGKPAGTLNHEGADDAGRETAALVLADGQRIVASGRASSWSLEGERIPYSVIQGPAHAEGLAVLGWVSLPWPQRVAVHALLAKGRDTGSGAR